MEQYNEIELEQFATQLQTEIKADPNNVDLRNKLAITYMELNEYEKAVKEFETAAKIEPNIQTLQNLAEFYFTEGKLIEEAEESVDERKEDSIRQSTEEMAKDEVEEEEVEEELTSIFEVADKEAFNILEKLIAENPKHYFPYNLMAEIYIKEEKYDEAIEVLKKAIDIKPTLENLHNLGLCFYKQGLLAEASKSFYKASLLRSDVNNSIFPLLSYGVCLAKLGKKEEAKAVAEELFLLSKEEDGDDGLEYCDDIADIYYFMDDFQEFVNVYRKLDWTFYSVQYLPAYFYALWKLSNTKEIDKIAKEFIQRKEEEIVEALAEPVEEIDYDQKEYEEETREEIAFIKETVKKIYAGERPETIYEPYVESRCYLFGCFRHGNPNPNYVE